MQAPQPASESAGANTPEGQARGGDAAPTPEEGRLLAEARRAAARAHAPYSGVQVGAALLDADGRVHLGCNVENASYGLTMCAERVALGRAVADGARHFVAVAVHADTARAFPPCGACRQVLSELAPRLRVLWQGAAGNARAATLDELLPQALSSADLPQEARAADDVPGGAPGHG